MKKYLVIWLIILFSLLSLTKVVFACEQSKPTTTTHSCCEHEQKATEHSCCQTEDGPKHDQKDHCVGKCKGNSCQQNSSKIQLFMIVEKPYEYHFFFDAKGSFYYTDNPILSGFPSIWLPPKIG